MTKMKTAVAVIAVAGLSVPLVVQQRALTELREENVALKAAVAVKEEPAPVAPQETAELERLRREAAEVPRLRGQIAALLLERQPAPAVAKVGETRAANNAALSEPMSRQALGDELAAQGKYAEALENYLWCYDEGAKKSPAYVGVRGSFLLMRIKELATKYPAAQEALLARRDGLEAAIRATSSVNPMSIHDLMQLNENLGEPIETMAFFDELPATHPARAALVEVGADQFLRAGRYQDMVSAGNPEKPFDTAVMVAKASGEHAKDNEALQAMMRRRALEAGGRGLEALAGVGQNERAVALADKILKFDNSAESRGELLKYAERATNAVVANYLKSR